MMSTTSVANATIKYIASNVDTIPPPSRKEVANRPSTTCYAYYSIIFQAENRKFYELLSHCRLFNEGGFLFSPRSSRFPRCLVNGVTLFIIAALIIWEAYERFAPPPTSYYGNRRDQSPGQFIQRLGS